MLLGHIERKSTLVYPDMAPECDRTHEVKAQLTAHEPLLVFSINPKAAKKERGRGQRV